MLRWMGTRVGSQSCRWFFILLVGSRWRCDPIMAGDELFATRNFGYFGILVLSENSEENQ